MTARAPLYWDEANSNTAVTRLTEMTSTDLQSIFQNAAHLLANDEVVTVSRVASGGNMGSMTDTRRTAGAATENGPSGVANYASEAATPDTGSETITYDTLQVDYTLATAPTYTDENLAFPVYAVGTGSLGIRAMSKADFRDTFILPTINALVSSGETADQGGTYFIAATNSVAGATLQNSNPVFIDRRADSAIYTSGGIPESEDQPLVANQYYLHKVNTAAVAYEPPFYIDTNGDIRQYTVAAFDALILGELKHIASDSVGNEIQYSLTSGASALTLKGTLMNDTVLDGTSAAGYTTRQVGTTGNDLYRTQEFPVGSPTTVVAYGLRIAKA